MAEHAAVWGGGAARPRGPFAGPAEASGFSERECAIAGSTGRLPAIVTVAKLRKGSVSQELAAIQARHRVLELRRRLLEFQAGG
jgi:hypothetical protein